MTLDVASGIEASVQEVVEAIVRAIGPSAGRPLFGTVPVRTHEQHVVPAVEVAASALGWRAATGLDDGLGRTVAWYRERSA